MACQLTDHLHQDALEPILNLIYINNLIDQIKSKARLFATYLVTSSLKEADIMHNDLDLLFYINGKPVEILSY